LPGRLFHSVQEAPDIAAIKALPDKEAYSVVVLQLEDKRKRAGMLLSKVIDALKRA
jgi:hypothetical protein